jgi:hypothetical protein
MLETAAKAEGTGNGSQGLERKLSLADSIGRAGACGIMRLVLVPHPHLVLLMTMNPPRNEASDNNPLRLLKGIQ